MPPNAHYLKHINFQYPDINMASTLNEAISYIALSKPINTLEHHIYDIISDDCEFQLTVILGPECIYIILTGYGTRVYDYSHAVAARVFIETLAILMGCDSFEGGRIMYINTVESLKDSFTSFKRIVYAYVWAQVKEWVYTETEETYEFVFRQFVVIGEDEATIKDKADKYLRSLYPADGYVITNIIPYKEVLTRELRKEISDVLEKIYSAQ